MTTRDGEVLARQLFRGGDVHDVEPDRPLEAAPVGAESTGSAAL